MFLKNSENLEFKHVRIESSGVGLYHSLHSVTGWDTTHGDSFYSNDILRIQDSSSSIGEMQKWFGPLSGRIYGSPIRHVKQAERFSDESTQSYCIKLIHAVGQKNLNTYRFYLPQYNMPHMWLLTRLSGLGRMQAIHLTGIGHPGRFLDDLCHRRPPSQTERRSKRKFGTVCTGKYI